LLRSRTEEVLRPGQELLCSAPSASPSFAPLLRPGTKVLRSGPQEVLCPDAEEVLCSGTFLLCPA